HRSRCYRSSSHLRAQYFVTSRHNLGCGSPRLLRFAAVAVPHETDGAPCLAATPNTSYRAIADCRSGCSRPQAPTARRSRLPAAMSSPSREIRSRYRTHTSRTERLSHDAIVGERSKMAPVTRIHVQTTEWVGSI